MIRQRRVDIDRRNVVLTIHLRAGGYRSKSHVGNGRHPWLYSEQHTHTLRTKVGLWELAERAVAPEGLDVRTTATQT